MLNRMAELVVAYAPWRLTGHSIIDTLAQLRVHNYVPHPMRYQEGFAFVGIDQSIRATAKWPDDRSIASRSRGLTSVHHFHIIRNMKAKTAVVALAALAQDTRLAIFRALVVAGPAGMPAGAIAAKLGIAAPTLSFHLKELAHAALVEAEPQGRFLVYRADFGAMNALVGYLTENCCRGSGACTTECAPAGATACAPSAQPRRAPAAATRRRTA